MQASTSSTALIAPEARRSRKAQASRLSMSILSAIHQLRQIEDDMRIDVHQRHGDEDAEQERHYAREDLRQLDLRWRNPLEIIGRHRHRWRQKAGLQVQRHKDTEEQRIDLEELQERQEDRHEDDDDLEPFQRPAEQEDDQLREQQELQRAQIQPLHEFRDDMLAAQVGKHRRKGVGADK